MHNDNNTLDGLRCFDLAERLDPANPLCKYQKGTVLVSLDRYEEALQVFTLLANIVPKEAPVHIMIGKIYKRIGQQDQALRAYNRALDLDPKDTNMVKNLIDKLDSAQEVSEDGADGLMI